MSRAEEQPLPAVYVVCAESRALQPVAVEKVFIPTWVWFLLPLLLACGFAPVSLNPLGGRTKVRPSPGLRAP